MTNEVDLALSKFNDGYAQLKSGIGMAKDDLGRDGVIQRFEFTFELAWKTLKILLKNQGIRVATPREALQQAFRLGWIEDEQSWLDMLDDRNLTSHIYSENVSADIFARIRDRHAAAIGMLVARVNEMRGAV